VMSALPTATVTPNAAKSVAKAQVRAKAPR
jgi:hypothetical protein